MIPNQLINYNTWECWGLGHHPQWVNSDILQEIILNSVKFWKQLGSSSWRLNKANHFASFGHLPCMKLQWQSNLRNHSRLKYQTNWGTCSWECKQSRRRKSSTCPSYIFAVYSTTFSEQSRESKGIKGCKYNQNQREKVNANSQATLINHSHAGQICILAVRAGACAKSSFNNLSYETLQGGQPWCEPFNSCRQSSLCEEPSMQTLGARSFLF